MVLLAVVLLFVRRRYGRYQVKKKQREVLANTNELEMEVQLPENDLIWDPLVRNFRFQVLLGYSVTVTSEAPKVAY